MFCNLASLAFPCSGVISPLAIACLTFAAASLFDALAVLEQHDCFFTDLESHEAFLAFESQEAFSALEPQEAFCAVALFFSDLQQPSDFDFLEKKLNPFFVLVHSFSCLSTHSFSVDFLELIAAV